jgi:hypothetical protein
MHTCTYTRVLVHMDVSKMRSQARLWTASFIKQLIRDWQHMYVFAAKYARPNFVVAMYRYSDNPAVAIDLVILLTSCSIVASAKTRRKMQASIDMTNTS